MSVGHPLTEEQIRYVCEHFSDMTNQELADAVGISKSAVSNVQKRFRLTKSEEHNRLMGSKAGKASSVARGGGHIVLTEEILAKRVASYKRTFREEHARTMFGLPQRTKIRVKKQPRKKCHQRAYLKHRGYIIDDKNNIAYYTPETRRATRMEARPRLYYHFKPYEEHQ